MAKFLATRNFHVMERFASLARDNQNAVIAVDLDFKITFMTRWRRSILNETTGLSIFL